MEEQKEEEEAVVLKINKEALKLMDKYRLSLTQVLVLIAMYKDFMGLLDIYDGDNTKKKILVEDYQALQVHGFLKKNGPKDKYLYSITELGVQAISGLLDIFEEVPDQEETSEKKTDKANWKLAKDYLELWPKIKLPSGVYARASIVDIEKRLRAFLKAYSGPMKKTYDIEITDELILKATKFYIDTYAKKGYMYMANSLYFISKEGRSLLSDEIVSIHSGLDKPEEKWTKQL